MKVLVLLSILALSLADECQNQAQTAQQCIGNEAKDAIKNFGPILKAFEQEISKCFNNDCPKPQMPQGARPAVPPPPPQAAPLNISSLPAEFGQCANGLKNHFLQCFPLPENFQPAPPAAPLAGPGGAGFGPGAQGLFSADPKEIGALVLNLCKGNKNAATSFFKCGLDAANKTQAWKPLISLIDPSILVCSVAQKCFASISDTCKSQFQQKKQQFCNCRNSTIEFAKQDSTCQPARDALKGKFQDVADKFHQQPSNGQSFAAAGQVFLPHPEFDICASVNPCSEVQAKLQKFKEVMQKIGN